MRVYKGLIPCPYSLIPNLDDMGKSSEAVGFHKKLEFCGVSMVGTIKHRLCGSDRIAEGDRRMDVRGAS